MTHRTREGLGTLGILFLIFGLALVVVSSSGHGILAGLVVMLLGGVFLGLGDFNF